MLGAILGDIVGSPFEFDHNNYKHKDFPLLSEKSHFTDDTVMTAAVAVGLIDGKGLPERTFCAVQHEVRPEGCTSCTSVQQALIFPTSQYVSRRRFAGKFSTFGAVRGPRKWSVLLRKKQARSTQGTRIASEKAL